MHGHEKAARVIQSILVRDIDPITLSPVRRPFYLYRNGVMIRMDAEALHRYVSVSGDLDDPVCKQRYASHEIMRLERVVGRKIPLLGVEEDRDMVIEFLMDELSGATDDAEILEVLHNLRLMIRSTAEEDWIYRRLRDTGIPRRALTPLVLMGNTQDQ